MCADKVFFRSSSDSGWFLAMWFCIRILKLVNILSQSWAITRAQYGRVNIGFNISGFCSSFETRYMGSVIEINQLHKCKINERKKSNATKKKESWAVAFCWLTICSVSRIEKDAHQTIINHYVAHSNEIAQCWPNTVNNIWRCMAYRTLKVATNASNIAVIALILKTRWWLCLWQCINDGH